MRTIIAAGLGMAAMHMDKVGGACALVKGIDVLRDHQNLTRPFLLQRSQSHVRGVGFQIQGRSSFAAHIIKRMNPLRIARKGLGGGDIFNAHLGPNAIGIAKGLEPRFLRDARARENHNARAGLRCFNIVHAVLMLALFTLLATLVTRFSHSHPVSARDLANIRIIMTTRKYRFVVELWI